MKRFLLNEAIKSVLVDMAIDCTLPSDMTQLDIHSVVDKAKQNLNDDPQYIKVCQIEKLGNFVSGDETEIIQMLEVLNAHEDPNEITGFIDGITMCERYETSFTVKQLLEEIR